MSESSHKYAKTVKYIPFKKRIIRASRSLFIIQGLILAVGLSASFQLRVFSLILLTICLVALLTAINIFLVRKRVKYFLQTIEISQDHVIRLELYRKNEKFDHQLNLENLDVKFELIGGGRFRRTHFSIVFSYEGKMLGFQSDFGPWKPSEVKDLFSSIKQYKGESLTTEEADLLKFKRGLIG